MGGVTLPTNLFLEMMFTDSLLWNFEIGWMAIHRILYQVIPRTVVCYLHILYWSDKLTSARYGVYISIVCLDYKQTKDIMRNQFRWKFILRLLRCLITFWNLLTMIVYIITHNTLKLKNKRVFFFKWKPQIFFFQRNECKCWFKFH